LSAQCRRPLLGFDILEARTQPSIVLSLPVSAPASLTAEATDGSGAVVTFNVSATDSADPNPTIQVTPASGSTFALGHTTVNVHVSDAFSNSLDGSFDVFVQDTMAPSFTSVPTVSNVEATSAAGAAVSFAAATATDEVSTPIIKYFVGPTVLANQVHSGSVFAIGNTLVTVQAKDAAGNEADSSFSIFVEDSTAPQFTFVPSDKTVEATSGAGAVATFAAATATDAVTANPIISYSFNGNPVASGALFPVGDDLVTVQAKDLLGNTNTSSFTIHVQDTTAPSILTTPANQTVEATSSTGAAVNFPAATANDLVSTPSIHYYIGISFTTEVHSGDSFPIANTVVEVQATDQAGNHSETFFNILVHDTTGPQITLPDPWPVEEATGPAGAVVTFSASANDLVSSTTVKYFMGATEVHSGDMFALGVTPVIVKATDTTGNETDSSFNITVQDTTAPVITSVPAPAAVEATSPAGAVVTFAPATATDVVSTPSIQYTVGGSPVQSGNTFAAGNTQVSVVATDSAGNSSNSSFTVTVTDHSAPAAPISLASSPASPANNNNPHITGGAEVGSTVKLYTTANPTVGDVPVASGTAVGGSFSITVSVADNSTTTFYATATDSSGNISGVSLSGVTYVEDSIAPTLPSLPNLNVVAFAYAGAVATYGGSATDAVSGTLPLNFDG
jgi:hypothetical protein